MLTTIVKCNPSAVRGRLRGYTIKIIGPHGRRTIDVLAPSGRDALNTVRHLMGDALPKVAA